MASARNNNAAADSTGGFKTVAFGFDKNDVTMYIASLRKKMKQMEEEFQNKLSEALDNPTASNEALKHEREVIRAEMETLWGEKLNERNIILKQQQSQINELEDSVHQKDKMIEALKAELSAANAGGEGGEGKEMNAKAAKAYVQFTTELRSATLTLQDALSRVEKTWRGEFEEEISQIEQQEAQYQAVSVPTIPAPSAPEAAVAPTVTAAPAENTIAEPAVNAPAVAADIDSAAAKAVEAPAAEKPNAANANNEASKKKNSEPKKQAKTKAKSTPAPQPVKIPMQPFDFGDEEEDPFKGLIADISDETPKVDNTPKTSVGAPANEAPKAAAKAEQDVPTAIEEAAEAVPEIEQPAADVKDVLNDFDGLLAEDDNDTAPAPVLDDDFGDLSDLGDLLAEPIPEPAKKPAAKKRPVVPEPKIKIDDDLSALLADELEAYAPDDIKPTNEVVETTDDFADILAQNDNKNKPGFGDDLIIAEDNSTVDKGADLDASLLSGIVITPGESVNGDLNQMLKEQEAKEYAQFGDFFVSPAGDDEVISFPDIGAKESDNENDLFGKPNAETKKPEKKEDDLFDFSFLDNNSDDEDDMSTDASFPGML